MTLGKRATNPSDDKNFFGEDVEEDDEVIVENIMANFGASSEEQDDRSPKPMRLVEAEIKQEAEMNAHYNDQNYWKLEHVKESIEDLMADYE